jgi:hypothetical protein
MCQQLFDSNVAIEKIWIAGSSLMTDLVILRMLMAGKIASEERDLRSRVTNVSDALGTVTTELAKEQIQLSSGTDWQIAVRQQIFLWHEDRTIHRQDLIDCR